MTGRLSWWASAWRAIAARRSRASWRASVCEASRFSSRTGRADGEGVLFSTAFKIPVTQHPTRSHALGLLVVLLAWPDMS